jgi:hypothetical protein
MRQILEKTDSTIQSLESQAERFQEIINEVNEQLKRIAESIARLERIGDEATAKPLQNNLKKKQEEHEVIQREISRISEALSNVEKMIVEAQIQNNESRQEIDALLSIGDDIDYAINIIAERDNRIDLQKQKCCVLREKLKGSTVNDTSLYEPRSTPPVSDQIKWVDSGIQSIPLNDLPPPEGISGEADFKKISIKEMQIGISRLKEMQLDIESGIGANSDYWAEHDRKHKLSYSDGYQRVFDAFFGMDAIKVAFDGEKYDIINGRHRIWLAQKMGVDYLPMRVTRIVKNKRGDLCANV